MDGISEKKRKYLDRHTSFFLVLPIFFVLVMLAMPRSAMALNAPSSLTATAVSPDQIDLAWVDNSSDETSFMIERDLQNDGVFVQIHTVGANVRNYAESRLADGSVCTYRVRAYKPTEYSDYSNSATAVTRTAYAISAPTGLPVFALSPTQVVLSWTDNSNNEAQFQIERGANRTGPFSVVGTVGPNITTYTDSGLAAGAWYYYQVRAVNYNTFSGYASVMPVQLWTITASAGAGGAISPTGTVAVNFGDSRTFMITPSNGYGIASVLVDGSSVGAVSSYPFSSISANHTITASFVDITPPTGSVVINSGSAATNNRAVVLTLSASDAGSGVTNMQFSWDNVTWYGWETYATTRNATIPSAAPGTYTICVKFRDAVGNVSTVFSDNIVLDTLAPKVTIKTPSGGIISNSTPTLSYVIGNKAGTTKIGVVYNFLQYLDKNDNGLWDGPPIDSNSTFGVELTKAVRVTGDWTGTGTTMIGLFLDGVWYLDMNGNGVWDAGVDLMANIGTQGDIPVTGDWNGDGITDIGVFRGKGYWYLDTNGNRHWESGVDATFGFGITGDMPVTGDWNGDGITDIGVFRGNGYWYLDTNGNRHWESGVDASFKFGITGDIPVPGDWNGDGITDVGVFRGSGQWLIDQNSSRAWDAGDEQFIFGSAGDKPITGDWNGDGSIEVGVFRGDNEWHLDMNASRVLDAGDVVYAFGVKESVFISGDWTGDGIAKAGIFKNGIWYLDSDGNGVWEQNIDQTISFGVAGDIPVTGDWDGDGITDVGLFRGSGYWYLDTNGNRQLDAGVDATFRFGMTGDMPVTGDWDGDGITDVGLFRGSGYWYLDTNGNRQWEAGVDASFKFGITGDIPVPGDWNGDGITDAGVFRGGGYWHLDANGNRQWDAGVDATFQFGMTGDIPVPGDWNGDGVTEAGVYRGTTGEWYVDLNGSRAWEWETGDNVFKFAVTEGMIVTGDWNGNGVTKTGYYRNGTWYLDMNGNGTWDGPAIDSFFANFGGGVTGAIPVTGDWNGDSKTEVGVYQNGIWYLDGNGNGSWDGAVLDRFFSNYGGGMSDAVPVTGDWNGDGITEIGAYNPGDNVWYLDYNGNGQWDGTPADRTAWHGFSGVLPVTGDWNGDGMTEIGVYNPSDSVWYLDYNGNGLWDGTPTDRNAWHGFVGAVPITGDWVGAGAITEKVLVDGSVVTKVSGDALDLVSEGTHTVRVEATDAAGNIGSAQVSFTVDTTPPTISIAPVLSPTYQNTQSITGTRESNVAVTIMVDTAATVGQVSYPTSTSWSCTLSSLAGGVNNITATAVDPAGNVGTAITSIVIYSIAFPSVYVSQNAINTFAEESTTIFFTIDAPATVTLKIIPEKQGPSGTPVYQVSQASPAAGAYFFTWDGKDNTGKVVPDEAYLFVLTASDGTRTGGYNPPAPTGTSTVSCSRSGFDPDKNIPMTVTFTPSQPSRVNIYIQWWGLSYTVLGAFPATPSSHTFDWDGRNPSNMLLDIDAYQSCSIASLLPENYIITTGDTVKVTDLKTDPYAMSLSYGQFTRITYTLPREAYVTVNLTSPSGISITLINNQLQAAGPQILNDWNGLDAADTTGKTTLITEEGDYMVSVQTVNPATGTSSTMRANVRIGY
jgi:flagellar hook assembly protein FlgD